MGDWQIPFPDSPNPPFVLLLSDMVGLEHGKVRLSPYSDEWPRLYESEELRIRKHLGRHLVDIQHIGSTAVPGMAAKPIIDIAVQVPEDADPVALTRAMARAGYGYKGEHGLPGREFYVRGDPPAFHLHLVPAGSPHWRYWLGFRDLLRSDAQSRAAYQEFKTKLAAEFPDNRDAYTAAKDPFISNLMKGNRPK